MNASHPVGAATFHVNLSRDGLWEIREQEGWRSLGAFAEEDDACAYADALARTCRGARVLVGGRLPAPPAVNPGRSSTRDAPTRRTALR